MAATEYALKKTVRNNTIVREVDEVRQREMWQSVCIGIVFVVVLVVSVWQHWQFRQYGYQMQNVQKQHALEDEVSRQLRLQIETLRAPARIQEMALKRGMVEPTREEFIVIERVAAAPRPSSSVVAAR